MIIYCESIKVLFYEFGFINLFDRWMKNPLPSPLKISDMFSYYAYLEVGVWRIKTYVFWNHAQHEHDPA